MLAAGTLTTATPPACTRAELTSGGAAPPARSPKTHTSPAVSFRSTCVVAAETRHRVLICALLREREHRRLDRNAKQATLVADGGDERFLRHVAHGRPALRKALGRAHDGDVAGRAVNSEPAGVGVHHERLHQPRLPLHPGPRPHAFEESTTDGQLAHTSQAASFNFTSAYPIHTTYISK